MAKPSFQNNYTALQREFINRMAEIEAEDADACAHCGGEDCACCEIYQDRQKWVSPDELFDESDPYSPYAMYRYNPDDEEDEDEDDSSNNSACDDDAYEDADDLYT